MLQEQRHGAASSGIPVQSGGLASSEGVSAIGNLEGVGVAGGSDHSREDGDDQADEGAHIDQGAGDFIRR